MDRGSHATVVPMLLASSLIVIGSAWFITFGPNVFIFWPELFPLEIIAPAGLAILGALLYYQTKSNVGIASGLLWLICIVILLVSIAAEFLTVFVVGMAGI